MKLFMAVACLLLSFINYAQTGNVGIGTVNPQAKLHTNGSIRFDTLAGAGERLLYTDANGNLYAGKQEKFINEIPTPLSAVACGLVTSNISVAGRPTPINPYNIKVKLNIVHSQNEDLIVLLQAPNGVKVGLVTDMPGADFTNTVLWDGAESKLSPTNASAPYTGTYRPRDFIGPNCGSTTNLVPRFRDLGNTIVPDGTWKLLIYDRLAPVTGTLINWSISFDGSEPGISSPELPGTINISGINTSNTGAANMLAAAYGVVYSNATTAVSSSSNNATLTHPATGTYVVSFTSPNLSGFNIGALPVSVSLYGGAPGYITYFGENGKITVNTFNSSWQPADRGFSFVVYKP